MTNPVVVVGGGAIDTGGAPTLRRLAAERRVGMLNTFAAKGLFEWNDPAHLGTIGLQEDDFALAGLGDADVLLVGVAADEFDRDALRSIGARWREVAFGECATLLETNLEPTPRPVLYGMLASVCARLYTSDATPMNPARAASDLAAWLPPGGVVEARRDLAGFWLGRTFPTRVLGSIRFDSRCGVRPTVRVVGGLVEPPHGGDIVEHWSGAGPALTAAERLERLQAAVADGRGVVLPLGVDESPLGALVAVAGAPLWHRPTF